MRRFLFVSFLIIGTFVNGQELISDRHFQQSIYVVNTTTLDYEGPIACSNPSSIPAWSIGEWGSQSTILNYTPTVLSSGMCQWADQYKDFRYGGPPGSEEYEMYITVNSESEFNNVYRTANDPWPSFIIQQRLSPPYEYTGQEQGPGCPSLTDLDSLVFQIDAKLIYNETVIQSGYDSNIHASQFPLFFTVQNLNPSSAGYGEYIWLGLLLYDDRMEFPPANVMLDQGTQALMVDIAYTDFASVSMHSGNWVHMQIDLLPYAIAALDTAWSHGYLTASTNLNDYKIGGMNLGLELTGLNITTVAVKNLSLVAFPLPPAYQATFTSMDIGSTTWFPGETRDVTVTVTNTGTEAWTDSSPDINLGCKWNNENDYNVRVDANGLAPGDSATYTFTMTAPTTPGVNNLTFDVVKEGDCWFGNNNGSCGPGNSVYISPDINIVVPDYQATFTSMGVGSSSWCAGETRDVTVTVTNTGAEIWTDSFPDINLGCKWNNENDYNVRVDANGLAPGDSATYTFTMTAPTTPGVNNLTFDVVKEGDCWFGNNNGSCGPGNSVYMSQDITINPQPTTPVISLNNYVLHSNAVSGNQWYNQNGIINGATNQDYTVTTDGDYYDIVTLLGCSSAPSDTINVVMTGIVDSIENGKIIKIYPNPFSNELIIEIEGNNNKINFEILNVIGQAIYNGSLVKKTIIQTGNLETGVYFIKLDNGRTFEFKKIIKE